MFSVCIVCFLFQAEDGIRDGHVTGVQTCLFRSFEERGFETNTPGKLTLDELKAILPDYHAMVVRSSTTVDKDLLKHAPNLQIIGRAGVGVDNIDIKAATSKGVLVMNTPDGNTIS